MKLTLAGADTFVNLKAEFMLRRACDARFFSMHRDVGETRPLPFVRHVRCAGDPLSGPSAVDAVMAGCMYINPIYATPKKTFYESQHPFLEQSVGSPHVCSYDLRVRALES